MHTYHKPVQKEASTAPFLWPNFGTVPPFGGYFISSVFQIILQKVTSQQIYVIAYIRMALMF